MFSFKQYKPYYKNNLIIAIPIVMSQLGQVLVQQVDNAMVGYVGTTQLAAAAFAGNIFIIGLVFGMGFTFGLTPIIGNLFTKGKLKSAAKYLSNSIVLFTMLGIISTIVLYSVSFFFENMNQPKEVVDYAVKYYRLLVYSYLPFILFFTLKQFFEGLGNTLVAMIITLASNFINIALNYLLIFGKGGFPELGLNGAGYASLISRVLMPVLFIIVFYFHRKHSHFLFSAFRQKIELSYIRKIVKIGFPISTQMLLEVSAFALSAVMAGWIGTVALASHQIAIGLASMTFMLVSGISSATTVRVSHHIGKSDYLNSEKVVSAAVQMTLFFMGISAIIFILFREELASIYTNDTEVIKLSARLLLIAAFFQLFDGLQVAILGALRGLEDVNKPMLYALFSYMLISLPLAYLLAFNLNLGASGIWISLMIGLIIASVLFWLRYKKIINYNIKKQQLNKK